MRFKEVQGHPARNRQSILEPSNLPASGRNPGTPEKKDLRSQFAQSNAEFHILHERNTRKQQFVGNGLSSEKLHLIPETDA